MDYTKILKRSFEVVRNHRALWWFGVLLALFGGGSGSGGGGGFPGGGGSGKSSGGNDFPSFTPPQVDFNALVPIFIAIGCVILVLVILGFILRFVSRAAMIGLVNELEAKQTAPTMRRGFRIGFDHFWRLLGIAFVINLPLGLVALVLLGVAAVPFIGALTASGGGTRGFEDMLAIAGAGSVVLLCCMVLLLIAVAFVVRPIYEFIQRACVVDNRGAIASIREGFRIVRANLSKVLVLYLLVIAVGIGVGIAMIPIALILIAIPVIVGFVFYFAMNALTPALIAGAIISIPVLIALIFISGLVAAYESTVWTEGYLAVAEK